MNTVPPRKPGDARPWYKERWTWLLMAMPATAVVAGGVTMWLAVKSFDGLVADDYYKQGLAINQTIAKSVAARELGLVADVKFTAETIDVRLAAKPGVPLPAKVAVTLSHPTRGGLDQPLVLAGQGGEYRGTLAPLASAHWKVLIEDEARSWRLAGEAMLPAQTAVRLDAAQLNPAD